MNCDMVGLIAFDEILGHLFRGMVGVAFERHIRNNFLHDSTANSACFRVPCDVIATFEDLRHLPTPIERKIHPAMQ